MPEPDFDTLAVSVLGPTAQLVTPDDVLWYDSMKRAIADQLRQVWNARGAADADAVFTEFGGPTPDCLRAAGAIRILDRV